MSTEARVQGWIHDLLWSLQLPFCLYSYDWSGQIYVTGSNDGHVFVCDARVTNNFKVLGHTGKQSFLR